MFHSSLRLPLKTFMRNSKAHYPFCIEIKPKKSQNAQFFQNIDDTTYTLPHPKYTPKELDEIEIDHREPMTIGDNFAKGFVYLMKIGFDLMSGYKQIFPWQKSNVTEIKWINRVIFLETVAGVPGFVGAMHRHLTSLRNMRQDYCWIHTLLEEAENERVHLLIFMHMKRPSLIFRTGVVVGQFYYVTLFSLMYLIFPRVCHRIVGYLEEMAVQTYTKMIKEIQRDGSSIHHWLKIPASPQAIQYWGLEPNATLLEVVKAVRKDEEHHKVVNHKFADDYTQKMKNTIPPGF